MEEEHNTIECQKPETASAIPTQSEEEIPDVLKQLFANMGITEESIAQRKKDLQELRERDEKYGLGFEVEELKNALLTYALATVKYANLRDNEPPPFSMDYNSMENELPMLSGCNTENACFSYISRLPHAIPYMAEKDKAIKRYLKNNLDTEEKTATFFNKFVELTYKKKSTSGCSIS